MFLVNCPAFFVSHRLPLALAARDAGWQVRVVTGAGEEGIRAIRDAGLDHVEVPLSRRGQNPLGELRSMFAIARALRAFKPDLLHRVTVKPVIYGGVLARLFRVPATVAAISGFGSVFLARGRIAAAKRQLIKGLYGLALRHPRQRIIFQNPTDLGNFVDFGLAQRRDCVLVPGSGVDLMDFCVTPEPVGTPVVVMVSRLLHDKGVDEFVAAARQLREAGQEIAFRLVGSLDPNNPATLTPAELEALRAEAVVDLPGPSEDVAGVFAEANLVVLPSYREGLPKVLQEAAACGRAVVTTDVPGCRDAITPGETGLLVPPRDAAALANAILALCEQRERRAAMGAAGRRLAEQEFAVDQVVAQHMALYEALRP